MFKNAFIDLFVYFVYFMYTDVAVSNPLEPELQSVVSHYVDVGN